jgi:hypothetical protein
MEMLSPERIASVFIFWEVRRVYARILQHEIDHLKGILLSTACGAAAFPLLTITTDTGSPNPLLNFCKPSAL